MKGNAPRRRKDVIKKCDNCYKVLASVDQGCRSCGCQTCYYQCEVCRATTYEPDCPTPGCSGKVDLVAVVGPMPRSQEVAVPMPRSPLVVRETYASGSFGVTAEVHMHPGDVEVLNDLGKLETLLHAVAAKTNCLQGHTDHTRLIIKEMRALALEVREEIELRCGPPQGGKS